MESVYHFIIILKSRSPARKKKIEADANVRVWKELVKNSERYSLFE